MKLNERQQAQLAEYNEMHVVHIRHLLVTGRTDMSDCRGCGQEKPLVTRDQTYLCYECAVKRDCTNE